MTTSGPALSTGLGRPELASRRASVASVPEVDGVVDAGGVGMLGEDEVGVLGCELDADDGLEVLARVEVPPDVEALALPALPLPEALDRARVVARQRPAEPLTERRAGRVVVDEERPPRGRDVERPVGHPYRSRALFMDRDRRHTRDALCRKRSERWVWLDP